MNRARLARVGEEQATQFLHALGYQILARNWRKREGELDIVALDGDTLAFIEVKTRRSLAYGAGEESIDQRKQTQLTRLAQRFLDENPQLAFRECRFDVVVVDMTIMPAQIRHYRQAFDPPATE
ncbi:MAG: YraN family protein [Fimbriimonadales bacterium]|nr:YraN family protein [Fimbriimonadales bacterium]